MTEEELAKLILHYDSEVMKISRAYDDGGKEPLWLRFERAALNQITDGDAMIGRYAIWANTVRDNIVTGIEALDSGDAVAARNLLVKAVNSLSAFSDVQKAMDPGNKNQETEYLLDENGEPYKTAGGTPIPLDWFDNDPSIDEDIYNAPLSKVVEELKHLGIPVPEEMLKELEAEKKDKK